MSLPTRVMSVAMEMGMGLGFGMGMEISLRIIDLSLGATGV